MKKTAKRKKQGKMGNPLAVIGATEVASVAKTKAGQKVIDDTFTAVKVAVLVAGAIFIAKYGYGQYKQYRAKKYARENAMRPEVQIALMFYNAMKGNIVSVLGFEVDIPDGTDEQVLNNLALQCDLVSVAKAYKILFDRELMTDINEELDSDELRTFFNRLRAKGSDTTTPPEKLKAFPKGTTVYCRNKNGITLLRADFKNGKVVVTKENKDFYEYAKEIGKIQAVVKDENGEIFYVIDRNYAIDSLVGYGWANHRDLTNINPDK